MTAANDVAATPASGFRWIWAVVREAARLARQRPATSVLLPLVLFAAPEAAALTLEIIFHPSIGFGSGLATGLAVQWMFGVALVIVVTRAAMRGAEMRAWRDMRPVLLIVAWQAICTVALAAASLAAVFVMAIGSLATHVHIGWGVAALGTALLGWSMTTLLMARWAPATPALTTYDHRGLSSALRRSAELTRGRRRTLALLQGVFLAGVLAMLVATGVAQAVGASGLSIALGLGVAPVGGLLLSFDALMKVAVYRNLGGREAMEGVAAVADVFE